MVVATGQSLLKVAGGGPVLEAAIDFTLIGLSGVLLLVVANWLSSTPFDPRLYPRIVLWCLGGVGVMFVFVFLRAVHPGVSTPFSFGTRAIALSIGSVAGLVIGIHEARALTREQELNEQNDELKRTQRALEQRNDELADTRVALEDTVRQLEASNEQLEQFASAASHDLREPLRMVTMYLELLDSRYGDALDDDAEEFIDYAVNGATRMQTMVDELLRYSRVETQGDPFESVDLEAVLEDTLTDLQVRIEETNATITRDALPCVEGDVSQLRQLFQNLVSNAIDYAGNEPPRIHVSAERHDSKWRVSVSDSGIGIEPADQERIFEIFQRLHSVDDHAGSGIGLALCHRIVERHGGEIGVDSVPGDGATFSFTVPPSTELAVSSESGVNS
nr:ATP-binding protein [Natronorubrum halalkaliphilum]